MAGGEIPLLQGGVRGHQAALHPWLEVAMEGLKGRGTMMPMTSCLEEDQDPRMEE